MVILGIDPGYAITGYGIIEYEKQHFKPRVGGVVKTSSEMMFPERLLLIYNRLGELITQHKPDCVAIEELFFSRNTTTAIGAAQARGVAVLAGAAAGIPVFEYTPMQVKVAVVGYGKADKHQVQAMVTRILRLKEVPKPDDAADALAVAICHAHTGNHDRFRAVGGYQ